MARASDVDLHHALGHASTDKRLTILRLIGDTGSISEAARVAGVSYKAAWQAVDTLTNLARTPLVERAVGGRGGGGAVLTTAGHELLRAADLLEQARRDTLDRLARERTRGAPALALTPGPAALGLRTSMRNALPCRVVALRSRTGAVSVALATPGGERFASRVTRESAQLLDLAPGREVLALFKATAVEVSVLDADLAHEARRRHGAAGEGRNVLAGEVVRGTRARRGGEVGLRIADGSRLVGFAGPGPGLRSGVRVQAVFDPAAVVIALPG